MHTHPVDDNRHGVTQGGGGKLLASAIVAALGSFLFGFDTAVISGTTADLTEQYHLSQGMLGLTVFIAMVGTVLGSAFSGIPRNVEDFRKQAVDIWALDQA